MAEFVKDLVEEPIKRQSLSMTAVSYFQLNLSVVISSATTVVSVVSRSSRSFLAVVFGNKSFDLDKSVTS